MEASQQAQADLRQHGIALQQQYFQHQADVSQQAAQNAAAQQQQDNQAAPQPQQQPPTEEQ